MAEQRMTEQCGLNLLLYPSALEVHGRLSKIADSLQAAGLFSATHIVGIKNSETTAPGGLVALARPDVYLSRIRGASMQTALGKIRVLLFWQLRVFWRYRRVELAAVAAQNVYLLPLAYHLSRVAKAVFAYNPHELETETIGASGFKKRVTKFLERRYIYRAKVVSVVNESIADWYRKTYPGIAPVVLTNAPVDAGGQVELRSKLRIPEEEILYIHIGFLMPGRNIPLILSAFKENPHAHVVFLGAGELLDEVRAAAAAHTNIHLLPLVPGEQVVATARGADAGLCLVDPGSLSDRLSTPNKLLECLAAGIAPLSSDLPEVRRWLGAAQDSWIMQDPVSQLSAKIRTITRADAAAFRSVNRPVPTWQAGAKKLVAAYRAALWLPAEGSAERVGRG